MNDNMFGKNKKILLVSHEMTYTGAPKSLLKMATVLRECSNEVEVWTLSDGPFIKEFKNAGFKVCKIDFPVDASEKMAKQLKEFELVIANTIFTSSFARYAQRYVKTVLYVREAHNIPQLIKDCGLNERDLSNISHMVCVSEYAKSFIEENYHPLELTVINNFVEDRYGDKKENSFPKDYVDFLVLGTIEPRKGQKIAAEAFVLLPDEVRQKARLHIAGAVPEWATDYWNEVEEYLSNQIIYHGEMQKRDSVQKLYESMDVVIVSSVDESCSLVALEAAMYGKALVVTENVGAKYLVGTDWIVETNNVAALSERMQKLIANPQLMIALGKKNRQSYLQYGNEKEYKMNLLDYISRIQEKEMKQTTKVSIIIPTYNVESYLIQCMESVVSQTLKDIEIICVNDGSTDGSLAILQEFQKQDSRIRIITTENCGYGHAVNTGIRNAKGEYIGIVEPDDYIDESMYEVLYHRAIATDSQIVKGDFYRFYGNGETQKNVYYHTALEPQNYNRTICPREEKHCFRFIMNTWSGIYRRDFIEKYQIYHNESPGASYQDNGFWFQGFCWAERVHFIDKALYYNRRDNPGSSVKDRGKVYVANQEYAWIHDFLTEHPNLEQEFIHQFFMKKWHTYKFTLNRIDWKFKKEFLQYIADEFRIAKENEEISKSVLTPNEWEEVHWIIRDSSGYYEKVIKSEIKVSVVIPVYNATRYLVQCLASLENQQLKQIEIICIDDGSTDDSKKILDEFASRDNRFIIYSQEHAGAAAARNFGLRKAKGEYIIFLDSDDYFAPEMLCKAWQKIRETESDICVMGSFQHDMQTGKITPCTYSLQTEHYPKWRPFCVSDMRYNPFRAFVGWAWDKLYRKDFLLNHDLQFQNLRTSNDMYFTYMSLYKAGKITILDECLIYQRRNVENSLSTTREKSWSCFIQALNAMKQELQVMGVFSINQKYFVNYALHSCLWNLYTLTEEIAVKLLEELKKLEKGGFEFLGISTMKREDAEYEKEYDDYLLIMTQGYEGLVKCRDYYRKKQGIALAENNLNKFDKRCLQHTRQIGEFESEADYYKYCLEEIRKSKSYKIGTAITWLPRKIRGW